MMMMMDYTVQDEGSIYILTPNTDAAIQWIDDNIADDPQHRGKGIVVEHRYITDIITGILQDGLTVQTDWGMELTLHYTRSNTLPVRR